MQAEGPPTSRRTWTRTTQQRKVDGRPVLRPLAEPERPPSASKKARKQHAKGETKTIGDFEREIAQRETEIAWRKAEIARLAAESDSMESN